MVKKALFFTLLVSLVIGLVSPGLSLEKVKLGAPVKMDAAIYLQPLAAEDRGFWKENDLEVEWVPFAGGGALVQAAAAGDIKIGSHSSSGPAAAAERGLPVVMVAELVKSAPFVLWVRSDSPYRHPKDLKGKRVAVIALGSATYAFGQLIAKGYGIEKDVRFIGAGGPPQQMAGLKVGAFEAIVLPVSTIPRPVAEGIVREVASATEFLPKPWVEHVLFARKDFIRSKPDVVRKIIRAQLQATDYIRKNPRWAMDKMKSFEGLSEEAAKIGYESIQFTTTGRMDRKGIENVRKLFIDYGIITEKTPAVDDLFTNEYLPG